MKLLVTTICARVAVTVIRVHVSELKGQGNNSYESELSASVGCNMFSDAQGSSSAHGVSVSSSTLASDFTLSLRIETGSPACPSGWNGLMGGNCGAMGLWFNNGLRNERQCGPHPGTSIIPCNHFSDNTQYWIVIGRSGDTGTMSLYEVDTNGGLGPSLASSTYTMESSYSGGITTIGSAHHGREYFNGKIFCVDIGQPTPSPTASPTASPTPSPTPVDAVAAYEDPHLTNTRGEHFDVWQLGYVQFLRVPLAATEDSADFVLGADIRNVSSDWAVTTCLSPYITETTVSGRSVLKPITISLHGPGRTLVTQGGAPLQLSADPVHVGNFLAKPILIKRPRESIWVNGKVFDTNNAVELLVGDVVIQVTAGKAHLNVIGNNISAFGERIGGVLGEDDHSDVSKAPQSCAKKHTLLYSRRLGGSSVSYSE